MADLEVKGAEKFAQVAKALKQAADKELRKELYSALNRATKPMRTEAKKSAAQRLPKAGGLNKRVARARMSTKQRIVKGNPSIKVVATGMDQLASMDQGMVRHPVYGNRKRWVNQPIPDAKGWFTEPMQAGAKDARREIIKALDGVAKKLARRY